MKATPWNQKTRNSKDTARERTHNTAMRMISRFGGPQSRSPEEVGHGLKGIMVGRISESQTFFYRGHEINMASFREEVTMNIDHFYLLLFKFAVSNPRDKLELVVG